MTPAGPEWKPLTASELAFIILIALLVACLTGCTAFIDVKHGIFYGRAFQEPDLSAEFARDLDSGTTLTLDFNSRTNDDLLTGIGAAVVRSAITGGPPAP